MIFGANKDVNAPAFLFKARSGATNLITLVDSGASECIISESSLAKQIGGELKTAEIGSGFIDHVCEQ